MLPEILRWNRLGQLVVTAVVNDDGVDVRVRICAVDWIANALAGEHDVDHICHVWRGWWLMSNPAIR